MHLSKLYVIMTHIVLLGGISLVWYIISAIIILLLGGLVFLLYKTYPISKWVYTEQLVKTSADKWNRVCSAPDNDEQMAMWEAGVEWGNANKERGYKNENLSVFINYSSSSIS